jgi:hypothetical protein
MLFLIPLALINAAIYFYLCYRVAKANGIVWALLTFFFYIPVLYPLIKNWGDEEHDIRWPFIIGLFLSIFIVVLSPEDDDETKVTKKQIAHEVIQIAA